MKKSARKVHKKKHIKSWFHRLFTQKGKGKMLPIIIVAVVVLLGGGFYVLSQKTGVSIPGMHPALNPNCELKDPELCKYYNNYVNMPKQYTVNSKGNFGGIASESTQINDGDSYQMITKQGDKEVSNVISIGDTTYTKDYTDNKWWKETVKPLPSITETPENTTKENFDITKEKNTTKYTFIGKEACGDLMCFKYQISDSTSQGDYKTFILFDDRDYLTRKMITQGADGTAMEIVYSYDHVSIAAPSPVKEGSPADAAGGAGGYSKEQINQMMQQYQQQAPQDTTAPADQGAPVQQDSSASNY